MDDAHIEQLAIWVADNLAPIDEVDIPLMFPKDRKTQAKLHKEILEILRYKD